VPREGQEVEFMGLKLRAERVQGRRLGRIRIHRLDEAGVDTDATAEAHPQ
jgi:hypothetical protein